MMAKFYHGAGSETTVSAAEKQLIEAFKTLPDDYTVIHSVKWLTHNVQKYGTEGEADFVIAHPKHGVLIIEAKGGHIVIEDNKWYSIDRGGVRHSIHDPFNQADRSRRNLMDWVENNKETSPHKYPTYTAVAFPDMDTMPTLRPDAPAEIIIDAQKMYHMETTLEAIFGYWKRKYSNDKMNGGAVAVSAFKNLLVVTKTLEPSIAVVFERERQKIDKLTEQQYQILNVLQYQRRASIVGGAGTGKTMLAMQKAKLLANAGFRVLLVCFNRNLADWMNKNLVDKKIVITTFHGAVALARQWAGLGELSYLKMKDFAEKAPDLLEDATAILHAHDSKDQDKLFDAIIVDEAQDFEDIWWIALPKLLKDEDNGILYVFFDDNQRIYQQLADVPIKSDPYSLTENMRNTQAIHKAIAPYSVTAHTQSKGPAGRALEKHPVKDEAECEQTLKRLLLELVYEKGIPAKDIVVLTPRGEGKSLWKNSQQMGTLTLSWFAPTDEYTVRVSTVHSFKGLESPVVILTEMTHAHADTRNQLVYVGLSRARNHVILLGNLPAPVR